MRHVAPPPDADDAVAGRRGRRTDQPAPQQSRRPEASSGTADGEQRPLLRSEDWFVARTQEARGGR